MILNPYRFSTTAPATAFDGFGNASRSFDGTDDYVSIPDNADIPTGAQTWSCWVKIDVLEVAIFCAHWNSSGDQRSFQIYLDGSGKINVTVNHIGSAAGNKTVTSTSTVSTGTWYHIAAVFSPSTHVKIFIDGIEDVEVTSGIPASVLDSTADIGIGAYADSSLHFDGNIADVRIYDADIGATEIANLAAGTDYQTNLVGHWLKDTDDVLDHAGVNDGTNNGSTYSYDNPSPAVEFGNASRSFDGTDDYIDMGDVLDSVFAGTGAKFTLSAWIKTTTLEDTDFLSKYNTSGQRSFLCRVLSDGNLAMVMSGNGNFTANRWGRQTDTAPISADTWHHVAITYDHTATGDYLRMWVDGIEDTTLTDWLSNGTFTSIFDGTAQLKISGIEGNSDSNWGGNIADVRIYDTDLSASDISDLYAGTHITTNLVGHWLTNNDDVLDYAGTNDGTNNGSSYSTDSPF